MTIVGKSGKMEKTVIEDVSGKSGEGEVRAEVAAELEADRNEVNAEVEILKGSDMEGVELCTDGVLNMRVVNNPNSHNSGALLLSPGSPNIRKWKRVARQVNTNKGMKGISSPIQRNTPIKQNGRKGPTISNKSPNCKVHLQLSPTIVQNEWAGDPEEKRKGVQMEEDVREVEDPWKNYGAVGSAANLKGKLAWCAGKLKAWSVDKFGSLRKAIKEKQAGSEALFGGSCVKGVQEKINRLEKDLEELFANEELYWRQRSNAEWL
ncbi:hypothetical protein Dsin_013307 [Dipteronia sinensis]|uniref:Uncharacterized protein n=1 Tax=Dipteronia sinensis TaxID=43782 RepID=A0AAE0E9B3_9ROSI|nr:hypothetical protein Dsin_013307 [Dipteronia sinensis]